MGAEHVQPEVVNATTPLDPHIEHILDAARIAPSRDNLQPWRFVVDGDTISFLIDHDQKLQAQASLQYNIGNTGFWFGANGRYDSGLVTGADPASLATDPDNFFAAPYIAVNSGTDLDPNRVKPRTIFDFSLGADLVQYHMPLSIQADLLNATNKKGVYNILSTFGGTHVIPPRMLAMRVRYTF